MSQETAILNPTSSSKKCFECGLRNFADRKRCARCKANLSRPVKAVKKDKQSAEKSGESNQSRFSFVWILALLVVASLGLFFFAMRQGSQGNPEVAEAVVAPTALEPGTEQPVQDAAQQNSQSEAAGMQILTKLKRFQDATDRGMDFDEYDKKLNILRTEVNDTLSSFVRHNPSDETFRQEVEAVLRDDTAAAQWWKTTIKNSTVFTEADRTERTQKNWASARIHLTNAEKLLTP